MEYPAPQMNQEILSHLISISFTALGAGNGISLLDTNFWNVPIIPFVLCSDRQEYYPRETLDLEPI